MEAAPSASLSFADCLPDHAERDRIEPGERLVVHDEFRVERHRAGKRHAPRHATRELTGHERGGSPQTHRVELQEHEVADHGFGQVGVLTQGKSDVVEHRQIGKERTELEEHPHAPAQGVELLFGDALQRLAEHAHASLAGAQLAGDETQQSRLARTAAAHHGHELPAAHRKSMPERISARRSRVDAAQLDHWICRMRIRRHRLTSTSDLPNDTRNPQTGPSSRPRRKS